MFHSTNSKEDFRPYLLRAWHEWSSDLGYTPHITVQVNRGDCKVPQAFVRDGSITFNISYQATNQLRMDNEWIQFQGRFGGQVHVISVPVHAVVACFVREKEEVMPLYFDDSEFDEINDLNDISNVNNANNVEK
jgi:stringent starvation protein B